MAGIGVALALILILEMQLRPVLETLAIAQVKNAVTNTLDGVIAQQIHQDAPTYGDLVSVEKDSSGQITALTSNMVTLNRLRTDILGQVVTAVDGIDTRQLSIPIGNLSGLNLLSGRGWSIPVRVVTAGAAHAEFQNSFSAAGINQTRHQILLEVTVTVDILLPGATLPLDISAQVPVAETVIVGAVPDTYLQLTQ